MLRPSRRSPWSGLVTSTIVVALGLLTARPAAAAEDDEVAAEGEAKGTGSVERVALGDDGEITSEDGSADVDAPAEPQGPWFRRHGPRKNMWEVGLFGGVWLPSDQIELHDRNLPPIRYDLSPDLGLRFGYYPLRHFGLEGELAMLPTRLETEQRAFVSTARAQAVVQLGLGRLVPFAVLGGGVLTVRSEPDAAGRNGDEALHVGGGFKYFFNDHILLRVDVRDVMSPKEGITPVAPAHSPEILIGFSVALGPRATKEEAPVDTDGDGFVDDEDQCPSEAGIAPDGCPARDGDGDGFLDDDDACPAEAGSAPDGCPILDSDGDGYLDPDDACPQEAGVDPDGCPLRDPDGDGFFGDDDRCPEQAEVANGFEDDDGCPDEIPEAVQKYTGVVEGIFFATGKSTIRSKSFPVLDEAVKVMQDYPALRVEISGHTDSRGSAEDNRVLSRARAEAVKQYMVDKGIAARRIRTRGAGPDEPVGDNATKAGRAQNRRIEFKLLTGRVHQDRRRGGTGDDEASSDAAPDAAAPDAETADDAATEAPAQDSGDAAATSPTE